jgi:hypothetical protein
VAGVLLVVNVHAHVGGNVVALAGLDITPLPATSQTEIVVLLATNVILAYMLVESLVILVH